MSFQEELENRFSKDGRLGGITPKLEGSRKVRLTGKTSCYYHRQMALVTVREVAEKYFNGHGSEFQVLDDIEVERDENGSLE